MPNTDTPTTPRTICAQCTHFLNTGVGVYSEIWYSHYCRATPLPVTIDPVTGVQRAYGVNALGTRYFVMDDEPPYAHCRDINTGDCPKYERRIE